jgi:hypothetical protein
MQVLVSRDANLDRTAYLHDDHNAKLSKIQLIVSLFVPLVNAIFDQVLDSHVVEVFGANHFIDGS